MEDALFRRDIERDAARDVRGGLAGMALSYSMLYFATDLGQNFRTMIVGIGADIAEVHRLREAVERHGERFLQRVFTPLEIGYCRSHRNADERFAARFAAKEAMMKALGTGWRRGIRWRDIEVSN